MALSREDILRGLEDDGLESSLDAASRIDPDRHAQNVDLAKLNNLPVDTVDRQLDEVKRRGLLNKIDVDSLRNNNPKTAQWLANKNNSSVAIDDVDILKGLEDSLKEPERGFWNNAARGGLDTVNEVTGNFIEFAGNVGDSFDEYMTDTLNMPNPGIVIGDDGISWHWDNPTRHT